MGVNVVETEEPSKEREKPREEGEEPREEADRAASAMRTEAVNAV